MFAHVLAVLWRAAGGTVATGIGVLIHRYGGVLIQQESHIKNAGLRDALEFATQEAESAAQTIVIGLNQSVTAPLKASGKWDAAAATALKAQAVTLLNGTLSVDAKAVLFKAMSDLPGYFATLIEATVATAPNKTTAPAVAPTT